MKSFKYLQFTSQKNAYLKNVSTNLAYVSMLQCKIHSPFKQEVICWKTSSEQGMVRPPIG